MLYKVKNKRKRHSKPLYKTKSQNKNVVRMNKVRKLREMNETERYPARETRGSKLMQWIKYLSGLMEHGMMQHLGA